MASNIIRNNEKYHAGDTIQIKSGATYFGFVGSSSDRANSYIYLPKEIGNDVNGFTITGSINFWGNRDGRITGCTFGDHGILRPNVILVVIVFPTGTTRTPSDIGYVNILDCTVTFI